MSHEQKKEHSRTLQVRWYPTAEGPLAAALVAHGGVPSLVHHIEQRLLLWRSDGGAVAAAKDASFLEALQLARDLAGLGETWAAALRELPPLFTQLVKLLTAALMKKASQAQHEEEEEDHETSSIESLMSVCCAALSNFSGSTARHLGGMTLEVTGGQQAAAGGPAVVESISIEVQFADYAAAETAARVWYGAVVLSCMLIERCDFWIPALQTSHSSDNGDDDCDGDGGAAPLRMIEIGCGPALVSLSFLASLFTRRCRHQQEEEENGVGERDKRDKMGSSERRPTTMVELWVTDVSLAAVETVKHSILRLVKDFFGEDTESRSPTFEFDDSGTLSSLPQRVGCVVHCISVDMKQIPPHLVHRFDVVLASDVIYDFTIAQLVAPAIDQLLRPWDDGQRDLHRNPTGGSGVLVPPHDPSLVVVSDVPQRPARRQQRRPRAILCCESHRDAMATFVDDTTRQWSHRLAVRDVWTSAYGEKEDDERNGTTTTTTKNKRRGSLQHCVLPREVNVNCTTMVIERVAETLVS